MSKKQKKPFKVKLQELPAHIIAFILKHLNVLAPLFLLIGVGIWIYVQFPDSLDILFSRFGFVFWFMLFIFLRIGWAVGAKMRNDARAKSSKQVKEPKPPLIGFRFAWREWFEIITFFDTWKRRVFYAVMTIALIVGIIIFPYGRTDPPSQDGDFDLALLTEGWEFATSLESPEFWFTFAGPLIWLAILASRCHKIGKERRENIRVIFDNAAAKLKYPRKKTGVKEDEMKFQQPYSAIQVIRWKDLDYPDEFFVASPTDINVDDLEPWNELQANLDARMPHEKGWRVEHHPKGIGATFLPADYPLQVLWEGQQHKEPLTFLLGADLDKPGKYLSFTFEDASPHSATVGGTGSGKTSVSEAIIAQAATKVMPWSEEGDPIYAHTYIVDPKGPFAARWKGRPNITSISGVEDSVNEDGDTISGIEAMRDVIKEYYEIMDERAKLVNSKGVPKWLDLDDATLREERLAPMFIALDEYLDHTDEIKSKSDQSERDNQARSEIEEYVMYVARKGRSLGFHIMLIAQMANMTALGSALMRQLVSRIIMGNMDPSTYKSFFDTTNVPLLPAARINSDGDMKTIPGRGRIMNAPGQPIGRMQAFFFGGKDNSETLDKFLPRNINEPVDTSRDNEPEPEEVSDIEDKVKEEPPPESHKEQQLPRTEPVDADELFEDEKEEAPESEACVVDGETTNPVYPCANKKCENKVCAKHKQSPDGEMWACPDCAKKHVLTRVKLGALYPWAKKQVESRGGAARWAKNDNGVDVQLFLDNVEVVKIEATKDGTIKSLDGDSIANGNQESRNMIKKVLA